MTYPAVLTEESTMQWAVDGRSLARFGDGELRIAIGGKSISQRADPRLTQELRSILAGGFGSYVLPCIPRLCSEPPSPRAEYFKAYAGTMFTRLYRGDVRYGSSFVSRPECAPWIDTPQYWDMVRRLWRGRAVAYVSGDATLGDVVQQHAGHMTWIRAPRTDAYAVIDDLERECMRRPYETIIIALGAAGTALAARLGRNGAQHALDLGHIGQFMKYPGAYAMQPEELVSPEYKRLLVSQHQRTNWGKGGHSWAEKVLAFRHALGADQVLDYGCGRGTLAQALKVHGVKCIEYDPGIPGKDMPPKLADLVVSTDVLEHVEPEKVDAVLKHIFCLSRKGAFLAIAKQPAKAILDDGRNAHLVCQPDAWWIKRLLGAGWKPDQVRIIETAWKKVVIECRKS